MTRARKKEEDTKRYFVLFCLFSRLFVWQNFLIGRRFYSETLFQTTTGKINDQTDTDTDVMMEKETPQNATTTTTYSNTKRRVEESNRMYARKVEEDAKKMREKKKAHQHSDAAGVKKSTRQRFDGKGCDEDLSSSEAFERRIKRECEKILKRLKSSFNTSS